MRSKLLKSAMPSFEEIKRTVSGFIEGGENQEDAVFQFIPEQDGYEEGDALVALEAVNTLKKLGWSKFFYIGSTEEDSYFNDEALDTLGDNLSDETTLKAKFVSSPDCSSVIGIGQVEGATYCVIDWDGSGVLIVGAKSTSDRDKLIGLLCN